MASDDFNVEWFRASQKRFREPVLVVPYFGAEKFNLKRHREYLNELGYDVILFDLRDDISKAYKYFFSASGTIGLKRTWAEQISAILDEIQGNVIIFSFSNPSASAIEVIARTHGRQIRGLICDGGPSGQLWDSMMNYFTFEKPLRSKILRIIASTLFANLWHPRYLRVIHEDLSLIPAGFPLLSIRGGQDPIITVQMIDLLFDRHSQIALEKLLIPLGQHLDGLKEFPELYKPAIERFLNKISTLI